MTNWHHKLRKGKFIYLISGLQNFTYSSVWLNDFYFFAISIIRNIQKPYFIMETDDHQHSLSSISIFKKFFNQIYFSNSVIYFSKKKKIVFFFNENDEIIEIKIFLILFDLLINEVSKCKIKSNATNKHLIFLWKINNLFCYLH